MLGSVQQEGSAIRELQKEDICQAFTIAAFTSSWPANPRSLCLGLPRHPPHVRENRTVFTHHHLHLVALSRVPLSSFPPSWPGTAPFTLLPLSMPRGNPCHAGGWHLRRKPNVGIFYVLFSRGIFAPRSLHPVVWMQHSFFLCILTSRCGASLNSGVLRRHSFMRSSMEVNRGEFTVSAL